MARRTFYRAHSKKPSINGRWWLFFWYDAYSRKEAETEATKNGGILTGTEQLWEEA